MKAMVGDRIRFHGRRVGMADRLGKIIEVHGKNGQPPYLIAFDDGHQAQVCPGPDCHIEPPTTIPTHHPVTDPGRP